MSATEPNNDLIIYQIDKQQHHLLEPNVGDLIVIFDIAFLIVSILSTQTKHQVFLIV